MMTAWKNNKNTRGAFRKNKKVAHFHEMDTI
jgi:hypothetical protein